MNWGVPSARGVTCAEVQVNLAYRWRFSLAVLDAAAVMRRVAAESR
jgi:hypothetical protein